MQALQKVEQKSGQPFLSPHTAQQQHHAMFTHNLPAHDFVHMVLKCIDVA